MEMEQLVAKIADEILRKLESQGGLKSSPSGSIAGMIDHTLLKQDANEEQIKKLCEEAKDNHFLLSVRKSRIRSPLL